MKPVALQDESERLAALRSYAVLDTPPEAAFDDLALLAARLCGTPMALIGLLDAEREWFKARLGFDEEQGPREGGFTAHVVGHPAPFVVADAWGDELLLANPLVRQAPGVRFVAGAPLVTSRGHLLGVLCVMDRIPRGLEGDRLDCLAALGRQALGVLELHRARITGSEASVPASLAANERRVSEPAPPALPDAQLESVLVLDGEGRVVDASAPAERMFGREPSVLVGRDCADVIWSPGETEPWRRWFARALAAGPESGADSLRLMAVRVGHGEFPAEVVLTGLAEGEAPGRRAVRVRDISGRERLERALKGSIVGPGGEARVSEAPSPAEVYEAAIRYLRGIPDVDHCALFLLSASRRELSHAFSHGVAAHGEQAVVPVDGPSVVAHVARSGTRHLTHAAGDDAGYKLAHPGRSELAIPLTADGEVVGVLDLESGRADAFSPAVVSLCESVASGISAALQGTNVTGLLLRAKVALEKTFDAMTDMVAILDSEGRIRRLNQAMASHLERPLRDLVGADFRVLFPFCRDWLAATSRTPPAGRSSWEEVVDPASGVVYELNLLELDIPIPVTGNRVVFMRDVTQEREMARQVIAFEKRAAAGDLLTGVAHEVRNPLAAIQAAAELLSQELPGDPDRAAPVGIICRQVERLKVLMQDLLHIGRPFDHLSVASGSLLRICEAAVGTWRENAGNRSRHVEILPQAREPFPVRVDAARIEQVIVNLLDNAAQHGRAGGRIEVLLSRSGGHVLLRVKDAGAGIASEALQRVFEPFFTTRANGTGLGLTLVKSIVEGHGGGVSLWNNEPPPGLTFEVRLPAAPREEP